MGILTLADFRSEAPARAKRTITDNVKLDRFANLAYVQIAASPIEFKELEKLQTLTTVVSTISYALPTDWLRYYQRGARITTPTDDRKRIRPQSREEYLFKTDYDTDGTPSRFHVFAGNVLLYTSPDKVYTIEFDYKLRPVQLVATTDKTVLEFEWDEAVLLGMIYRIYFEFQEHERFLIARNEFLDYIRERIPAEDREPWSDSPLQVAETESDLELMS